MTRIDRTETTTEDAQQIVVRGVFDCCQVAPTVAVELILNCAVAKLTATLAHAGVAFSRELGSVTLESIVRLSAKYALTFLV